MGIFDIEIGAPLVTVISRGRVVGEARGEKLSCSNTTQKLSSAHRPSPRYPVAIKTIEIAAPDPQELLYGAQKV